MSNPSKEIVLAYHGAFHKSDRKAVRKLLADKGAFIGPLSSFTDADTFLDAATVFMHLSKTSEIKQVVADGNNVCILYDYETLVPSLPVVPIASWFKVESGKISFFHTHFDPTSIVKAQQSGDIARALETRKGKGEKLL